MTKAGKIDFLKREFIPSLKITDPGRPAAWGKMNFIRMVEHLSDSFDIASGKIILPGAADEWASKRKAFLMTEKPFKENTRNPFLPENPATVRHHTVSAAINDLQMSLLYFFEVYEKNPAHVQPNPIFGNLSFDEQIRLAYKHVSHHLRQFGVEILQAAGQTES